MTKERMKTFLADARRALCRVRVRKVGAGNHAHATAQLAQASVSKPDDTQLAMRVAALQAWFRNDADLAATRERMLTWAADATKAEIAEGQKRGRSRGS